MSDHGSTPRLPTIYQVSSTHRPAVFEPLYKFPEVKVCSLHGYLTNSRKGPLKSDMWFYLILGSIVHATRDPEKIYCPTNLMPIIRSPPHPLFLLYAPWPTWGIGTAWSHRSITFADCGFSEINTEDFRLLMCNNRSLSSKKLSTIIFIPAFRVQRLFEFH